ncbi:MAG TPA: GGDEF domain-containing protein [Gammaproteobacteria bacterium]|nr:GGDEF domain-containing protein [Gammaproteobacteria bacterium]
MASLKTPHNENLDSTSRIGGGQNASAARMQRAVLKLAFSFYGHSPDLDERLKRLGNLIKAGRKDGIVQSLIDEVVDLIIAREGSGASAHESSARQLADLIGRLSLEGSLAEEARAMQRRLQSARGKEEFERQFNDVVGLFNTLARRGAHGADGDDEPRESALFDNFLAELQVPPELDDAMDLVRQRIRRQRSQAMVLDCARDVARMLSSRLREVPSPASPDSLAAAVALARAQLQSMVEQLVLPPPIAKDTLRIKAQLDGARSEHDIHVAVSAILDLLNQARGRSQQEVNELAAFLKAVTRRLEDFKSQVARSNALHDESISSTTIFQRVMASQVADMRDRVDVESDIDTLKLVMINQLESLEASVQNFVQGEQTRQYDARSQFEQMLGRLNELETETQRLRSDLDEQHTLSLLDPLTAVFNRMGYNEGMSREYARWQRYGGTLSLLIFDLDLFKSINDTYGHAAGDKVLASVAQLLRKQIRHCDILCRLGGEEFAIILPETDVQGAAIVAEKLRASIANSQFRFKEQPVPVTVSIGVAEFRDSDTQEDVFERADRALYLAKKRGRNRCCTELELDDASGAAVLVIEANANGTAGD